MLKKNSGFALFVSDLNDKFYFALCKKAPTNLSRFPPVLLLSCCSCFPKATLELQMAFLPIRSHKTTCMSHGEQLCFAPVWCRKGQ